MLVIMFRLVFFTALFLGVLAVLNGCSVGRYLIDCAQRSVECQ